MYKKIEDALISDKFENTFSIGTLVWAAVVSIVSYLMDVGESGGYVLAWAPMIGLIVVSWWRTQKKKEARERFFEENLKRQVTTLGHIELLIEGGIRHGRAIKLSDLISIRDSLKGGDTSTLSKKVADDAVRN